MKRTMKLINMTKFKDKDLEEIALGLLAGQFAPSFYLICVDKLAFRGVTLTNHDKPTIIICFNDLNKFAQTFVHELIHLQQHSKGYANEDEAYKKQKDFVVTA